MQRNEDKNYKLSVRRPLLKLPNRLLKGHLEGGPANMTANVARVEQILYVMLKISYCPKLSFFTITWKKSMSAVIMTYVWILQKVKATIDNETKGL